MVDDRVRRGLSKEEIHFMGTMAGTIMRHMEMLREVEEHRRGMKMSRGLASFVEGRSQLVEAESTAEAEEGITVAGQFEAINTAARRKSDSARSMEAGSRSRSVSSIERKEKEYSSAILKTEETIMLSSRRADKSLPPEQREGVSDSRPTSHGGLSSSSQVDIIPYKADSRDLATSQELRA